MSADAGHRSLPHTADTRIQAWAPTTGQCIAQAVLGMAKSFLDLRGAAATGEYDLHVEPGEPQDQLVAVLDEIIYLMDTTEQIPIKAVALQRQNRLSLHLTMADLATVPQTGAVPKAVALHQLTFFEHRAGQWTCTVTLDV
ncbi:archease [Nonomuraea sp. NPDC048916]|uniref:archease n=1 Tax=Nonomuraea sp. NPDC048916 TaxID=3154232 RepID=UPI0034022D7D